MGYIIVNGIWEGKEGLKVLGSFDKIIVSDIKTFNGIKNRFYKWYPFKEATIYSFRGEWSIEDNCNFIAHLRK